ncbi:MAG: SagB/ThcOx family dehydrogenase [Gemmatimonadota bacterium]
MTRSRTFRRVPRGALAGSLSLAAALALVAAFIPAACRAQETDAMDVVRLPPPRTDGEMPVETALSGRRSVRSFRPDALALEELGQVLWAAQGVSRPVPDAPAGFPPEWKGGLRTAPSAGALYPLELHAVVGAVEGLEPGLYRYLPVEHALRREATGDLRAHLSAAALGQGFIGEAPVSLVVAGVVARTAAKYGDRAGRYVHMEVGAAAENVYLQCASLGLATVLVGAFRDADVARALRLPAEEDAFAILPIGRPAAEGPRR